MVLQSLVLHAGIYKTSYWRNYLLLGLMTLARWVGTTACVATSGWHVDRCATVGVVMSVSRRTLGIAGSARSALLGRLARAMAAVV
jgi:hypothetical protein